MALALLRARFVRSPPLATSFGVTEVPLTGIAPSEPISTAWLMLSWIERESIRDFTRQVPAVHTILVQSLRRPGDNFLLAWHIASCVTKAAPPRITRLATGVVIVAPAVWLICPPTKRSVPFARLATKLPVVAPGL